MSQDKKYTDQQQFIVDRFNNNHLHDSCIHKHFHSKAWFQTNARSWHPVSDQTIKALVKKGFLYKADDNHLCKALNI
jgi:hypothetical protein